MRFAFAISCVLALGACGHGHEEQFDTLQECVVDHTVEESLTEVQAVATCLADHVDHPDFADQAACEAYVTANGGYPDSRVMACMIYFEEQ